MTSDVYGKFSNVLLRDITFSRSDGDFLDHMHRVARRLGRVVVVVVMILEKERRVDDDERENKRMMKKKTGISRKRKKKNSKEGKMSLNGQYPSKRARLY
jgi:hypothetical protein